MLGISDLRSEFGKFGKRLFLGIVAHPVERLDALLVGLEKILDERFHSRLGLRREVLGDIDFAQYLADRAFFGLNGPLPSGPVFLDALQFLPVKSKALIDERF